MITKNIFKKINLVLYFTLLGISFIISTPLKANKIDENNNDSESHNITNIDIEKDYDNQLMNFVAKAPKITITNNFDENSITTTASNSDLLDSLTANDYRMPARNCLLIAFGILSLGSFLCFMVFLATSPSYLLPWN